MVVWLVYYSDWSTFGIFDNEVEALRHAVEHSMKVKKLTLPCADIGEAK